MELARVGCRARVGFELNELAGIGRVAVSVTLSNSTASQLLPIAAMPVALPSKGAESDASRDTAEATVADATDAETP